MLPSSVCHGTTVWPRAVCAPALSTVCRQSGRSWRCISCSSARPAQRTCWWTFRGSSGTPQRQSPSCAPCDRDDGPPRKNGRWRCAEGDKEEMKLLKRQSRRLSTHMWMYIYLEVHEIHQLGDFRLQHLHCLLIDLHSVGLLIAFYLEEKKRNKNLKVGAQRKHHIAFNPEISRLGLKIKLVFIIY